MYANKNNDMAVSPIVATLVLIVVAVIGAVAVGTIMGTFSTDVSKQASSNGAATASATEILIAGSTTLMPAEMNLQGDYQRANPGIHVNVQGGGSSQGPQAVAMGIADIGAVSSGSSITTAQTANPNDPIYQNLYFTQIGGRGVVFIQNKDGAAVPTGSTIAADVKAAYEDVGANGKTNAVHGTIASGTLMEQREAGSGTMSTAFGFAGMNSSEKSNGVINAPINNGNAQELASVQSGTQSFGFVDSGYAITGGVTSTTVAANIALVNVTVGATTYSPTHTAIKNALHDWYLGNAQDTTGGAAANYPQNLVGGLYWLTKGNSPSAFTGNRVTTAGVSAAGTDVVGLINFAKTPAEAAAFNNVGMYSMYDFS